MDGDVCKIKQILELNASEFDENFIQFLLHDSQNLKQLSKLINALEKVKAFSNHASLIHEPSRAKPDGVFELGAEIDLETYSKTNAEIDEKQDIAVITDFIDEYTQEQEKLQSDLNSIHQETTIVEVEQPITASDEQVSENVLPEIVVEADIVAAMEKVPAEIEQNRLEIENVFRRSKYEDVRFQVDNARVGQAYQSKITVISPHDAGEISYKAESFKFPDTQFYFDEDTQSIQGQPVEANPIEFSFQFIAEDETRSAQCRLNVIADPRSLWKVIEPEAGQEFVKTHLDQAMIDTPNYKIVAASRRGRSHEHVGSFRDDDFAIHLIEDSPWSVITVADGAGSAKYSREGSRIAVEIVQSEFQRYLNPYTIDDLNSDLAKWQVGSQDQVTVGIATKLNQQFHHVYYEIYKSILNQIELQATNLGANTKDFSTTLLVAVVCKLADKTFVSTFSVGDGAIALYSESNLRLMNDPDGGEYAGQTRFLDRSIAQDFTNRLKIGCFTDVDAILLMTDGISDPIFETDSGLLNLAKWQKLYAELDPMMKIESADTALLEWMPFYTPGHHNDRTMAVLWNKHSS